MKEGKAMCQETETGWYTLNIKFRTCKIMSVFVFPRLEKKDKKLSVF
jgi:hypothetical protein